MPSRLARPPVLPVLACLAAGCTPPVPDPAPPAVCPDTPFAEGETFSGGIPCADLLFPGGDGDRTDLFLGNDRFRAVFRHPQASLSLAGLGGMTLVDAAPWSRADVVYEIAPLVGGAWLDVDGVEVDTGTLTVTGLLRALPAHDAVIEGERATVTWRVASGDPWLYADGADGFWIHTSAAATRVDGWLMADPSVIGHDGTVTEDLGGAIVVSGASRLLFADTQTAWSERPGDRVTVNGTAAGATGVDLLRGTELVGRLPVAEDGTFAGEIPATVDGLRAIATARAPSPIRPPAPDLTLTLGAGGTLVITPVWPEGARQRPVRVAWTSPDGRSGMARLAPAGARVATGGGVIDLDVSAGPAWVHRTLHVELSPGEERDLPLRMEAAIGPGTRVLASLAWPSGHDRSQATLEAERIRQAVASGLEFAIVTTSDDVSESSAYLNDGPWIQTEDAVTLTSPQWGTVTSWPWSDDLARSGHGAPYVRREAPLEVLHLAWGGPAAGRTTRVDLTLLAALGDAPWAVDPTPDYVALDTPGAPPFDAWAPWFRWLDAGRFLRPSGPLQWLDVGKPERFGSVEIQRALAFGTSSCGTGPWLTVQVDGVGPGGVVPVPVVDTDDSDPAPDTDPPLPPGMHAVVVEVRAGEAPIDRVTLMTEGTGAVDTFLVEDGRGHFEATVPLGLWTTAVAWSTTTGDWATVTPVWTRQPTARPPATP